MAKRTFMLPGQTFTAAAVTTALASNTYMGLTGGSTTQLIDVLEVLISGKATASIVAAMELARVSTIATANGVAPLASPASDGPLHPSTAALAAPPVSFTAAGTGPQASAVTSDAKLNFGLNLFGGIIRWNAAPTQQWSILGNTANLGQSVLWNSSTGGGSSGLVDAHILYEPW